MFPKPSHISKKERQQTAHDELNKFRWATFCRDDWHCVNCGASRGLHAHHIIHGRRKKDNDPDNGITLCAKCHEIAHGRTPSGYEGARGYAFIYSLINVNGGRWSKKRVCKIAVLKDKQKTRK